MFHIWQDPDDERRRFIDGVGNQKEAIKTAERKLAELCREGGNHTVTVLEIPPNPKAKPIVRWEEKI